LTDQLRCLELELVLDSKRATSNRVERRKMMNESFAPFDQRFAGENDYEQEESVAVVEPFS